MTDATTAQQEPVVGVSDLSVEYAAHGASAACVALHGVSFDLEPGETLGVLGESGSGKSTLARLLAGRADGGGRAVNARITGGDATVCGFRLRRLSARSRARLTFHVGYLAQDAAATLPADRTIGEIVADPIFERDRHYNRRAAGQRVAALLEAVLLPLGLLSSFPYELSAGQRQRVALARALVLGPDLLIADEPTTGIDVTVRQAVIDVLATLGRQNGFSAILVSQDAPLLRSVTSRVAVLQAGRLVGLGPLDELLRDPPHPYVASLARAFAPGPSADDGGRIEA
ncbi:dipeptide/oligopeptide/nickel ABC transporter ATP-binding protein [Microbacterium sp. STN6]|uniref:ATP-binding cassette domain-containing protein n=1 Tax=Microbacterium sp. STN6 TaxID=2995588 RepID=UPI002260FF05|nr:dipeptide/oligopeptide/nickel ABC transporter ATP-binding protein [Microbacterium sp. STN6]MCX7522335.1 dipeptide/oligopeptide/nickel ABC transporter ATP-binding protein [Microbacterium sp. STN6]